MNIPSFLWRQHLTAEEEKEEIASLGIHVEQRIQRVKAFHIFDKPIPLSIASVINEIWALKIAYKCTQSSLLATWDLQQQQSCCSDVQRVISVMHSLHTDCQSSMAKAMSTWHQYSSYNKRTQGYCQ